MYLSLRSCTVRHLQQSDNPDAFASVAAEVRARPEDLPWRGRTLEPVDLRRVGGDVRPFFHHRTFLPGSRKSLRQDRSLDGDLLFAPSTSSPASLAALAAVAIGPTRARCPKIRERSPVVDRAGGELGSELVPHFGVPWRSFHAAMFCYDMSRAATTGRAHFFRRGRGGRRAANTATVSSSGDRRPLCPRSGEITGGLRSARRLGGRRLSPPAQVPVKYWYNEISKVLVSRPKVTKSMSMSSLVEAGSLASSPMEISSSTTLRPPRVSATVCRPL